MRRIIRVILVAIVVIPIIEVLVTNRLNSSTPSLTSEEIRFAQSFKKDTVVIYKSAQGQLDTITFFKPEIDTIRQRNFVELGWYNEIQLVIAYKVTNTSFHKFTVESSDKDPEHLLVFLRRSDWPNKDYTDRHLDFLGLSFDRDYVNKILQTKDDSIVFTNKNAEYEGVNINEGIKSFTFDFQKGILSYIDKKGIEWVRSK